MLFRAKQARHLEALLREMEAGEAGEGGWWQAVAGGGREGRCRAAECSACTAAIFAPQHDRALAGDEHLGAGLERGHASLGRAPHGVGRSLAGRQGQAGGRGGEESEHVLGVGVMRHLGGRKPRTPATQSSPLLLLTLFGVAGGMSSPHRARGWSR